MRYLAYGHLIESSMALPPLRAVSKRGSAIVITVDRRARVAAGPAPKRRAPGLPRLRVTEAAGGRRLQFSDGVDCIVSADGRAVCLGRAAHTPVDVVRRLLIGNILPLVLSHIGRLVLHASAFSTSSGAVVFLGSTGAGKSTLAASFGLMGAPIVSDDVLLVSEAAGSLMATPSGLGVAVWPDSLAALKATSARRPGGRSTKQWLDATSGMRLARRRIPIRRVYVLDPVSTAQVEIEPVSPRAALMALVAHSYVLDPFDRARLTRQFERACGLVPRLDVRRLRAPRQLGRLGDVCRAITADLDGFVSTRL